MTDEVTPKQFHEAEGVEDWRVVFEGASVRFRTGSFAKGVAGHLVSDEHAPAWWTLADAEGNEADVATWMGRD